jgi:hypothetical protein
MLVPSLMVIVGIVLPFLLVWSGWAEVVFSSAWRWDNAAAIGQRA